VVSTVTKAMQNAESVLRGDRPAGDSAAPDGGNGEMPSPFVTIRASVKPEYLVCLDCGAKVKTLKRHLTSAHGLDPKAYREKWGLKRDYPMTAPAYSEKRSAMAKSLGLGRKAGQPMKRKRGVRKAAAG
jgi:predicted transcriptional regulator